MHFKCNLILELVSNSKFTNYSYNEIHMYSYYISHSYIDKITKIEKLMLNLPNTKICKIYSN